MDINLKKEKFSYAQTVLNNTITQEETMDIIVPDSLPDIMRIVCADAAVFLRSKDADAGRVSVSGTIAATVIYCPDGVGGVRKLEVDIPFTMSASGADISATSKVVAEISLVSAEAIMAGTRKAIFRAEIAANLKCYNETEFFIATGCDDDTPEIEMLTKTEIINLPSSVREKTYVLSDEFSLSSAVPPISEVLQARVSINTDDSKTVGNKLIFRGSYRLDLLYRPAGGGDICSADFSAEYSQIMEYDSAPENGEFIITPMLTSAYFDTEMHGQESEGRSIITELHIVAQCVAVEKREVTYISDAYSTSYAMEPKQETIEFWDVSQQFTESTIYKTTLEADMEIRRVIALCIHCSPVACQDDTAAIRMNTKLHMHIIFESADGRIFSTIHTAETGLDAEHAANCEYSVLAYCGSEIFAVSSGNSIDLRVPVDFKMLKSTSRAVSYMAEGTCDDETPIDMSGAPSVIICRCADGDSIWKLAKKYNSTPSIIREMNELEDGEPLSGTPLLIIPKKR